MTIKSKLQYLSLKLQQQPNACYALLPNLKKFYQCNNHNLPIVLLIWSSVHSLSRGLSDESLSFNLRAGWSPSGRSWCLRTLCAGAGPGAPGRPGGPVSPGGPVRPRGPAGPGPPLSPAGPGTPRSPGSPGKPRSPWNKHRTTMNKLTRKVCPLFT